MVVTTGFFDGVHIGHRLVIETLVSAARERGTQSVAVTFWPHPRTVLQDGARTLRLLSTLEEKKEMLLSLGVDKVEVLEFTREFSTLDARTYLEKYVRDRFGASTVVLGYDNRFGRRNPDEGFDDYVRYGKEMGIEVVECDPLELADGKRVSSTLVRDLLTDGRIEEATEYLGHRYSVEGTIVNGFREGRKIGFPTANLAIDPLKIIPAGGVYAVKVHVEGDMVLHNGMMNIGHRPTYGENGLTLETNIFRFRENIYGKKIRVEFCKKLRNECRFDSVSALARQLAEDAMQANDYLFHPDALPLTRKRFLKITD